MGEANHFLKVHLLNDFSKFIEASGHKHACLLQSLVLGYCCFRSLIGTSSGMAKLDLKAKDNSFTGLLNPPREKKGYQETSALITGWPVLNAFHKSLHLSFKNTHAG